MKLIVNYFLSCNVHAYIVSAFLVGARKAVIGIKQRVFNISRHYSEIKNEIAIFDTI